MVLPDVRLQEDYTALTKLSFAYKLVAILSHPLCKALKKNVARNQVVIASKVYFNEGRLSRQAIMREIDGTLSRLGTDYHDLYIIQRFDYDTPIEETMEALHDLVKAGKVRALGASAMYGYQFYNMQLAARDSDFHCGLARCPAARGLYGINETFICLQIGSNSLSSSL